MALVDRLSGRTTRIAASAVLAILAALAVHNVPTALRNQRELPRDDIDEMDEWFEVQPRDLEHVASASPRHTVFGRIAVFYFLEQRIGGSTLTIPDWWEWNRWELEHVAHLRIEIASPPLTLSDDDARFLRESGERRRFQPRSRKAPKVTNLYLHRDPAATRYVLVQSNGRRDYFVLPEEQYRRLHADDEAP